MDAAAKLTASDFVKSVAQVGSRISSVLHNYASLEGSVGHNLSSLMGNLDASIHFLNQICSLLTLEEQTTELLNNDGLKYVESLAEECSVTFDRIKWIITGDNRYEVKRGAKYWETSISTNEKGQKVLVESDLDEAALFRSMKAAKGRVLFSVLADPTDRLDYLQLLLLLVVQVMTVQDMTKKLPSGTVDLASIVEYHTRIVRAAEKLSIASSDGLTRHTKSWLPFYSLCISSDSDSDIISVREPPRSSKRSCGLSPPPKEWMPLVPPPAAPPKEFALPTSEPPLPPASAPPSAFAPRIVELGEEASKSAQSIDPPLYSEKDRVAGNTTFVSDITPSVTPSPLGNHDLLAGKLSDHKGEKSPELKQNEPSPDAEQEEKSAKTPSADELSKPITNDDARLLTSPSSGLGMKLKSLFRSKSSLEAEMKQALSNADASLKAFIIQHGECRKVPHSAFHSLEYTHMRTILWQLKDNAWFKTFSDLTDAEHDATEKMMAGFWQGGKWFKRELVVLKVMQDNKYNAWMRVMEECMRIEWGKPHHENYRIILAIVREKQSNQQVIPLPPRPPPFKPRPRITDCYDPPQAPRVPDPLPTMQGDKMIVDLEKNPALGSDSFASPRGPPPSFPPPNFLPSGAGRPPPPPPPPPGWLCSPPGPSPSQSAGPLSPSGEIQLGHSEVIPQNAISDESAREALTSYEAFTFRPALQQQSPLAPLRHLPPRTWFRCFITREREETRVLLQRIQKFHRAGISVIDLKLQLTEQQAAQVTNLVQELNQVEKDKRFEHKIVELSMIDREHGIVTKQTTGTNVDVIHVITMRAIKQGVPPLVTYNTLMNRGPPPRGPPPGPPPFWGGPPPPRKPADDEIVILEESRSRSRERRPMGRARRRGYSSSYSDSSIFTVTTASSVGRRRKGRNGRKYFIDSDLDSVYEEHVTARWKEDPATIIFRKAEKGKDVVQLLLEKWTPAGDGKVREKDETKEEKDAKKKKRRSRRRVVSDSDSLFDD